MHHVQEGRRNEPSSVEISIFESLVLRWADCDERHRVGLGSAGIGSPFNVQRLRIGDEIRLLQRTIRRTKVPCTRIPLEHQRFPRSSPWIDASKQNRLGDLRWYPLPHSTNSYESSHSEHPFIGVNELNKMIKVHL
jgi:hypothetical protein